jgi:hypothetical protein
MVIKKGVIKNVPENMEFENWTEQFNSYKQNKHLITLQVIDAVTLKMRVKEANEETERDK